MTWWIFQANPETYDVVSAIQSSRNHTWVARQNSRYMHPGDPVFIWLSGKAGGIIATALIQTGPYFGEMPDDQMRFARKPEKFPPEMRVNIAVETFIWPKRLTRDRIKADAILSDLMILSMSQQTNYKLSDAQGSALRDLVDKLM